MVCSTAAFTQISSSTSSSLNQFIGANLLATGSIFPFFFLSFWCLRLDWIGCTQPCSFAALTHVDLLHNATLNNNICDYKSLSCIHIISLAPNITKLEPDLHTTCTQHVAFKSPAGHRFAFSAGIKLCVSVTMVCRLLLVAPLVLPTFKAWTSCTRITRHVHS